MTIVCQYHKQLIPICNELNTTLLKLHSPQFAASSKHQINGLIPIYLSAAFDTTDYSVLTI